MRKNNGHSTKRITIVVPESTEVVDITYYWKTQFGNTVKTATALMDTSCEDGVVNEIYKFPDLEEDGE